MMAQSEENRPGHAQRSSQRSSHDDADDVQAKCTAGDIKFPPEVQSHYYLRSPPGDEEYQMELHTKDGEHIPMRVLASPTSSRLGRVTPSSPATPHGCESGRFGSGLPGMHHPLEQPNASTNAGSGTNEAKTGPGCIFSSPTRSAEFAPNWQMSVQPSPKSLTRMAALNARGSSPSPSHCQPSRVQYNSLFELQPSPRSSTRGGISPFVGLGDAADCRHSLLPCWRINAAMEGSGNTSGDEVEPVSSPLDAFGTAFSCGGMSPRRRSSALKQPDPELLLRLSTSGLGNGESDVIGNPLYRSSDCSEQSSSSGEVSPNILCAVKNFEPLWGYRGQSQALMPPAADFAELREGASPMRTFARAEPSAPPSNMWSCGTWVVRWEEMVSPAPVDELAVIGEQHSPLPPGASTGSSAGCSPGPSSPELHQDRSAYGHQVYELTDTPGQCCSLLSRQASAERCGSVSATSQHVGDEAPEQMKEGFTASAESPGPNVAMDVQAEPGAHTVLVHARISCVDPAPSLSANPSSSADAEADTQGAAALHACASIEESTTAGSGTSTNTDLGALSGSWPQLAKVEEEAVIIEPSITLVLDSHRLGLKAAARSQAVISESGAAEPNAAAEAAAERDPEVVLPEPAVGSQIATADMEGASLQVEVTAMLEERVEVPGAHPAEPEATTELSVSTASLVDVAVRLLQAEAGTVAQAADPCIAAGELPEAEVEREGVKEPIETAGEADSEGQVLRQCLAVAGQETLRLLEPLSSCTSVASAPEQPATPAAANDPVRSGLAKPCLDAKKQEGTEELTADTELSESHAAAVESDTSQREVLADELDDVESIACRGHFQDVELELPPEELCQPECCELLADEASELAAITLSGWMVAAAALLHGSGGDEALPSRHTVAATPKGSAANAAATDPTTAAIQAPADVESEAIAEASCATRTVDSADTDAEMQEGLYRAPSRALSVFPEEDEDELSPRTVAYIRVSASNLQRCEHQDCQSRPCSGTSKDESAALCSLEEPSSPTAVQPFVKDAQDLECTSQQETVEPVSPLLDGYAEEVKLPPAWRRFLPSVIGLIAPASLIVAGLLCLEREPSSLLHLCSGLHQNTTGTQVLPVLHSSLYPNASSPAPWLLQQTAAASRSEVLEGSEEQLDAEDGRQDWAGSISMHADAGGSVEEALLAHPQYVGTAVPEWMLREPQQVNDELESWMAEGGEDAVASGGSVRLDAATEATVAEAVGVGAVGANADDVLQAEPLHRSLVSAEDGSSNAGEPDEVNAVEPAVPEAVVDVSAAAMAAEAVVDVPTAETVMEAVVDVPTAETVIETVVDVPAATTITEAVSDLPTAETVTETVLDVPTVETVMEAVVDVPAATTVTEAVVDASPAETITEAVVDAGDYPSNPTVHNSRDNPINLEEPETSHTDPLLAVANEAAVSSRTGSAELVQEALQVREAAWSTLHSPGAALRWAGMSLCAAALATVSALLRRAHRKARSQPSGVNRAGITSAHHGYGERHGDMDSNSEHDGEMDGSYPAYDEYVPDPASWPPWATYGVVGSLLGGSQPLGVSVGDAYADEDEELSPYAYRW